jgi:hypothetical protein
MPPSDSFNPGAGSSSSSSKSSSFVDSSGAGSTSSATADFPDGKQYQQSDCLHCGGYI